MKGCVREKGIDDLTHLCLHHNPCPGSGHDLVHNRAFRSDQMLHSMHRTQHLLTHDVLLVQRGQKHWRKVNVKMGNDLLEGELLS